MSVREKWEGRYQTRGDAETNPASRFLTAHRALLPSGRALDVACGDGRHALWLARHGFAVDAIDLAYAGLARLTATARREQLVIQSIQANLEQVQLPTARYAVVVNCRYLQRSLFAALRDAVRPGG